MIFINKQLFFYDFLNLNKLHTYSNEVIFFFGGGGLNVVTTLVFRSELACWKFQLYGKFMKLNFNFWIYLFIFYIEIFNIEITKFVLFDNGVTYQSLLIFNFKEKNNYFFIIKNESVYCDTVVWTFILFSIQWYKL